MKIVKVNTSKTNAYNDIRESMAKKNEISLMSGLDACGCTGNGNC